MHILVHFYFPIQGTFELLLCWKDTWNNQADLVKVVANDKGFHFLDIHDELSTLLSTLCMTLLIQTTRFTLRGVISPIYR